MRTVYSAVLALSLLGGFGAAAGAADLDLHRKHSRVHATHYNDSYRQRLRVVEQVPYCGDCEAPIGRSHSSPVRLIYSDYPVWERGCALGGCYGYYDVAPSCYWRDTLLPGGRSGVVRVCDWP